MLKAVLESKHLQEHRGFEWFSVSWKMMQPVLTILKTTDNLKMRIEWKNLFLNTEVTIFEVVNMLGILFG